MATTTIGGIVVEAVHDNDNGGDIMVVAVAAAGIVWW